jgi:hypothetical protein
MLTGYLPVVWTKDNPTPWNDIKQDENVKMHAVSHKFDKSCVAFFFFFLLCYYVCLIIPTLAQLVARQVVDIHIDSILSSSCFCIFHPIPVSCPNHSRGVRDPGRVTSVRIYPRDPAMLPALPLTSYHGAQAHRSTARIFVPPIGWDS